LGRRIAKSVNDVVTWYVYDGSAIIAAYDLSGTVTARYAHGLNIDEPLDVQQGSVKSFYHADGLGSIVTLTNAASSVVQTYSYDSFGNITPSGGITQPYTYTAREYDNETSSQDFLDRQGSLLYTYSRKKAGSLAKSNIK